MGSNKRDVVGEVLKDMEELKKLGVVITDAQIAYVLNNPDEIREYRENGLKIHEITDLIKSLA